MIYSSVLEASKGLLVDAISLLERVHINFIVIGGWCPLLRNTRHDIPHPGTKDVDILFKDADIPGQLQEVVREFLDAGYVLSAKHDFQLLFPLDVQGQTLVFNIDLLHPSEGKNNPEVFVDHFEFDFCENEGLRNTQKVKSIVLPSSAVLFDGFHNMLSLTARRPSGVCATVKFPLLNEAGLVLSKCQSVKSRKRERDSFDLFLVLSQANVSSTIKQLGDLYRRNEGLRTLIDDLQSYLEANGPEFDRRVQRFVPEDYEWQVEPRTPCARVRDALRQVAEHDDAMGNGPCRK